MDQLVRPKNGFVPAHYDTPIINRYIGTTVFVDHLSNFTYVHLMTKMNGETTVEAEKTFERITATYNVQVFHYHSDNGLFDTKSFRESVQKARQTLSFCGVNAHHQHRKAENRIQDVTTGSRTSLLYASHRLPEAIDPSLWHTAIKHYVDLRNDHPTKFTPEVKQGRKKGPDTYKCSPLSQFSATEVESDLDTFKPFGSPVYVLSEALQAQHSHNEWSDRSKVKIFMWHSPNHAFSVPRVLNNQTGMVTPQSHCIYNDELSTCKKDSKFISLWQCKTKLHLQEKNKLSPTQVLPTTAHSNNSNLPFAKKHHPSSQLQQYLVSTYSR